MAKLPEKGLQGTSIGQPLYDKSDLGRTSGQRTAEIFAGLRAELLPSPVTTALSQTSGRVIARLMTKLAKPELFNFVPVRLGGFTKLIEQTLPRDGGTALFVDLAAGFSPRGLQLAQAFPYLDVIEVDLPDVIEEKQKRLQRIPNFQLPLNLSWRAADLGKTPLSEVLEGQLANIVSAEGLLPYFSFPDITRIARQVQDSLKPGGTFFADIGYLTSEGQRQARGVMQVFRRQTRTTPGTVNNEETARQLFVDAQYKHITIYKMPEIAEMFQLPTPAPDMLFFIAATKELDSAN
jgi:O-methyltransferase involved in polyketide biosynthesis